jgi:hypothetical protein
MALGYVPVGGPPRAAQLNGLTAELDSILKLLFSGKSPLIYWPAWETSGLFGKPFYFGDDTAWPILDIIAPSATVYDHSTYTTFAAGLSVDDQDDAKHLAYSDSNDPWTLDDSLEAHTTQIDPGTGLETYWWARRQPITGILTARERYRRLDVAEIIIEGWDHSSDFDWEAEWDKYHFLRFHNLDPEPLTVNLPGSVELTIPAFGIQAVRRTYPRADEWSTTYLYMWEAISGDQLIIDGVRENNVASLLCFHQWLGEIALGTSPVAGVYEDPRTVWDGRNMLPRTLATDCRIGELLYHLGNVLSFDDADTTGTAARDTIADWATLELAAGVAGVTATASGNTLTISAATGMTAPVDAMGVTSNILPASPTTLPVVNTDGIALDGDAATGIKTSVEGLSAQYTDQTDPGDPPIDVEEDVAKGVRSAFLFDSALTVWGSDLDDAGSLDDDGGTGTEVVTIPSVSWSSDGWRIVGHGSSTLPTFAGYAVTQTELRRGTFTSTTVALPFGGNVIDGRDDFADPLFSSKFTREISDYVGATDIFDQVFYYGHPDAGDAEGLDAGIDWEPSRQINTASEFKRDEAPANQQATRNLPVYVLTDTGDRVLANYETAGWYLANRADAQSLQVEDEQKLVRVKVMAAHFNRVSQRLQSITHIYPFTADDVLWYGDIEDGTWPWAEPQKPTGFHRTVLSSGSRVDALGITVSSVTYDSTTGYYVTQSNWAAWAAGVGLTFHSWRLRSPEEGPIAASEFPTLDSATGATWWRYTADSCHLGGFTTGVERSFTYATLPDPPGVVSFTDEEKLVPPADWFNITTPNAGVGFPAGQIWVSEYVNELAYGTESSPAPSGWQRATDDRLLIYPIAHIGYADDPHGPNWYEGGGIPYYIYDFDDHEMAVVDPIPESSQFVLRSSLPDTITGNDCADQLDGELVNGQEGFLLSLCPRLVYVRTP